MPDIQHSLLEEKKRTLSAMRTDRLPWWRHWRDLANYILPRRYVWLQTNREWNDPDQQNRHILDGTGTQAARTLASGMMNGITSPARPWFRLRIPGRDDEAGSDAKVWLDEVQRRMLLVMAESNFYNALAVLYLDLVVFGTSAMLIYEDDQDIIRCYNSALGEYYIAQDFRLQVNTFAREFSYKVHQVVARWGEENVSRTVLDAWRKGGERLQENVRIAHLVEPNRERGRFEWNEYYWEMESTESGRILEKRGFREMPGVFPRWEIVGNDAYGQSPGMDALADIIQLQHETKEKAKSLDLLNQPPMLADSILAQRPSAFMARGQTFVPGLNAGSVGAKPAFQINPPLQEMTLDIADVRQRVREIFHNDLFRMISNLETVRSATEIDARREEKLVLLGPVLERFENEALDPAITRIFSIMERKGLLPPAPPELDGQTLEVQYVSVLSDAQRAVGTAAHERLAAFIGELAAVQPELLDIPDWEELVRDYAERLGVPAKGLRSRDIVAQARAQRDAQQSLQEAAQIAPPITDAAKQLSETDVGGGGNALQAVMGG